MDNRSNLILYILPSPVKPMPPDRKRVSFLGPEGTFTDHAAHIYAGDEAERIPFPEMHQVVAALEANQVDEAVAPIENSIGGAIIDIVDYLIKSASARIKDELLLQIEQCLITLPGTNLADIKTVMSKPEALSQCRIYLDANLPDAERVPTASTVDAARIVSEGDNSTAAIGPARAAQMFNLPILAKPIQDRQNNTTRFVVLAHEDHEPTGSDKTSLVFSFMNRDAPGQLHAALGAFASRNVNLAHIESRPTGEELGSYVFVLDILGHRTDPEVAAALADLSKTASFLKVLGSYPKATEPSA